MSKTKILLIIPNLGKGGAQKIFLQQLENLSGQYDVLGCVFNWDGAFKSDSRRPMVLSLDVPGGKNYLLKLYYFILRIHRLRKLKRQHKINLSISHLEGADYVNILSARADKVLCWIHGTKRFDENISGLIGMVRKRILMPIIYKRSHAIVTVSKGIEDELKNTIPSLTPLLRTIYNGFDISDIQNKSLQDPDDDFLQLAREHGIGVTHCRLSVQKNLLPLLMLTKAVLKHNKFKLVIIGDGELRQKLIDFSRENHLKVWTIWDSNTWDDTCDVFFLGQKENPFQYLRLASFYIMTSNWEGFPLALCEAMVCQVPVISADCFTGPREIIAPDINHTQPVNELVVGKYGLLMPLLRNDSTVISLWAKAIQDLFKNKELRDQYAHDGINQIRKFELKSSVDQTIALVESLISKR